MTSSERINIIERIVKLDHLCASLAAAGAKKSILARYYSRAKRLRIKLEQTRQMRKGVGEARGKVIKFEAFYNP